MSTVISTQALSSDVSSPHRLLLGPAALEFATQAVKGLYPKIVHEEEVEDLGAWFQKMRSQRDRMLGKAEQREWAGPYTAVITTDPNSDTAARIARVGRSLGVHLFAVDLDGTDDSDTPISLKDHVRVFYCTAGAPAF